MQPEQVIESLYAASRDLPENADRHELRRFHADTALQQIAKMRQQIQELTQQVEKLTAPSGESE